MIDVRLARSPASPCDAPSLDDGQRRVVQHGGGPLLVLAGPGTGKTTTLVEAAVARVRAGIPVESILMLTFSRRAANELRDRVTARLAGTVREPIARTVHSYAFGLLRLANLSAGLPAPRLLSGAEQDVVIRELLAGRDAARWPAEVRPALSTLAFADELRDLLMRAVERGLTGPTLAELGRREHRPVWVAAGRFLTEYQQVYAMQDAGAYDPSELVRTALQLLESDPRLLAAERARRRHVFIDEYQDIDPAQAELLALMARGAEEVVVVGDPDQSIYGFRGADEGAMREVDARFGDGKPVPVAALRTCRRSAAPLVAASRRIAARLTGPAEHRRLLPAGPDGGRVDVSVFRTAGEEAAYVAATLRRAHLDGTPWPRMAVLVRSTGAAVSTIRRALASAGVPVTVRGEGTVLSDQPAVRMLLEVLRCVADPAAATDDVAERLLLGPIGGADVVVVRRLRRALRVIGRDQPATLSAAVSDPMLVAMLPDDVGAPVQRVAAVLDAGRRAAADAGPEQVLWSIWDASGLARRWGAASLSGGSAGAAADRDLDAVLALFETVARFTDRLPREQLPGLLAHIEGRQIPGSDPLVATATTDAVDLLTAHAAKGLEWDLVCVAGVQEGLWPRLGERGTLLGTERLVDLLAGRADVPVSRAAALAEERRLFYVAVTRARRELVVTAVAGDEDQPSRFLDELDPVSGARTPAPALRGTSLADLVAELRTVVCDPSEPVADRQAAATELGRLARAGARGADPDEWWGLAAVTTEQPVAMADQPVPVSPSRIEAYLRCELRALLRDVGARDGDSVSASLGTLVHEIAAIAPPDATAQQLEALLDERWPQLDFAAGWHAANERQRAGDILRVLLAWLQSSRRDLDLVAVEQAFATRVGDALLTGRVDRLERDADGRLVVVDLKTTKTRVRQQELAAHPQLAAYQLAVESGAFAAGERSGGARLVQLAAPTKAGAEQGQPPLREAADPDWIAERIETIAGRLRGSQFRATANPDCARCELTACCPLSPAGRQVISR